MSIRLTAAGSGLYRVRVGGAVVPPGHTTEREACERVANYKRAHPLEEVDYFHDYAVSVSLEPDNVPPLPPNPAPAPPSIAVSGISQTEATLHASAFSDPDADAHTASEWQVDEAGGDWSSLVASSGESTTALVSYAVAGLQPGTPYQARARYCDSDGAWSSWSVPQNFTTTSSTPPPSQATARFQSDWHTIPAGTTGSNDGGKWQSILGLGNGTVTDAPVGWPCHKVCRIVGDPAGRSGAHILTRSGLGEVPVGGTRNWRYLYAAHLPDSGYDCGQHPIQDGGAVSQSNWYMGTAHCGGNLQAGQWGMQFNLSGETSRWSHYKWGLWSQEGTYTTPLTKGHPYRVEIQVFRVSASEMRLHLWVHDGATGALVADDRNFVGTQGGITLDSRPLLRINSAATMGSYVAGLNGIAGTPSWPAHHNDQSAHAIVDGLPEGQQIGAYGNVAGEVPR